MEIKQINECLANLSNPVATKGVKLVESVVIKGIDNPDGEQGESGEHYRVYSTPVPEIFMKITYGTDSYGDNEYITTVAFVKQSEKSVIIYEPI